MGQEAFHPNSKTGLKRDVTFMLGLGGKGQLSRKEALFKADPRLGVERTEF